MTGLEPATSGVTGRCSNQLSYIPFVGSTSEIYPRIGPCQPPAPGLRRDGAGGLPSGLRTDRLGVPRVREAGGASGGRDRVRITKAVITAAGRGARQYPAFDTVHKAMLPLVDRDGLTKPVLQIIVEEALESGIEEVCVVTAPGDEAAYRRLFATIAGNLRAGYPGEPWADEQARRITDMEGRLRFVAQDDPAGYGHAVWSAREFVGDEPFLLLLSDHLYISGEDRRCARQLLDLATAEGCAASAVQATREHLIGQYGTVAAHRSPGRHDVYVIDEVVEKPNPTLAELRLGVPGLRAGHYLCFFGMHVLTPEVMALLDDLVGRDAREGGSIQLSTALHRLAGRQKYLALETRGARHNLGVKYGLVEAQVALAMAGVDRAPLLASLLESVARVGAASAV